MYLFKSRTGAVLYIGKAQNLRTRVRSYLSGGDGRIRVPRLVARAQDVDVVVTSTVKEALLLENELIKQHKPPFNVRLRDDKQYLALRLDPAETWPRLVQVRRFKEDGAHYFGPYTSSHAMREALGNLRRIFPLRTCRDAVFRDYERRGRPCIEYEMKRCPGPCVGLVEREPYEELVRGTILFLRGKSNELMNSLRKRMAIASDEERFEDAARLRDQIHGVEKTVERQQIVADQPVDRDVFGVARSGGEVDVQVLHVRGGRVVGTQGYTFSKVEMPNSEVMSSFLSQYYVTPGDREVPAEVITPLVVEDDDALASLLAERASRRVILRHPRRGPLVDLVRMANNNAELGLERRLAEVASVEAALEELRDRLSLRSLPRTIEGYDISTLNGTLAVASRVTFEQGQPAKARYRRYRIRSAEAGDDYACLREVFGRRLARAGQDPLPDLLLVDGGRGQLGVLSAALRDAGLDVDAISLSKERDDESPSVRVKRSGGLKNERVFVPNRRDPVMLPPSSRGLLHLQRIRDESHRFAIEFQRDLRSRMNMTSILEELPGIGPGKRRALLRELGSLRAVRSAPLEQLASVSGISARDATVLFEFFHHDDGSASGNESHRGNEERDAHDEPGGGGHGESPSEGAD
ncbi:excinuclease ABC subunit UvrC [Myxococcota bacterium]|nr:excinuclease ABC subunit UvrC [Myxococcota bacterium]